MTDRRDFLQALAGAGAGVWSWPAATRERRPRVEAAATVFHAHPNAEQTLVRFRGFDIDAIAGRMRVYGADGNLMSTAGVIRRGDHLYGEAWLPLRRPTRIRTELEVPGQRGPIRDQHRVEPSRQWTLVWVTVADPHAIARRLENLTPWHAAVDLALLRRSRVMTNPLALARSAAGTDHLPVLRASEAAREVERWFGVPASPVAITDGAVLDLGTAPLILRGNGVEYAMAPGRGSGEPLHVRESPDGSRIVIAETAGGGDPASLGFAADRDAMAAAVERWLESGPTRLAPELSPDVVLVLSTDVEAARGRMIQRVEEWNARFAYPRIVVGDFGEMLRGVTPREVQASSPVTWSLPTPEAIREAVAERRAAYARRLNGIFEPVRQVALARERGVEGFLAAAAFPYAGHVACNASPFPKSALVTFPDGREQLVTNTPALGYAYLPDISRPEPAPARETGVLEIIGGKFTARLHPVTGAITSLAEWDSGREWSDPELGGINHVPNSRIEEVTRVTLPDVGSRLEYSRRTPHGRIHTTVTLYDDDPWCDIVNRTESDRYPIDYFSGFALDLAAVEWEIPGGRTGTAPPTAPAAHVRWIHLRGNRGSVFVRGLDSPFFRVESRDAAYRLVSLTTGGVTRYRIDTRRLGAQSGEPERFGWDAEPIEVFRVAPGGRQPVPSFSRVVRTDPSTVVLGVKMAEDGFAAIVYLQNPLPFAREAHVEPALLRFDQITTVDFVERNLTEPRPVGPAGVEVPLPPHGVVAVRLSGLSLDGG